MCVCVMLFFFSLSLSFQSSSTMDSKPRRLPFTVSSSSSLSSSSSFSSSSSALSAGRLYGRGSVLGSERFSRGAVGKLDSDYQVPEPDADPRVNGFSRVPVGRSGGTRKTNDALQLLGPKPKSDKVKKTGRKGACRLFRVTRAAQTVPRYRLFFRMTAQSGSDLRLTVRDYD